MEKRRKGETVKVKIVDMADSGAGIGKDAGFAVFVVSRKPPAIPVVQWKL